MEEQQDGMEDNIILSALKAQQDRQVSLDVVLRGTEILEDKAAADRAERAKREVEAALERSRRERRKTEAVGQSQHQAVPSERTASAARDPKPARAGEERARVSGRRADGGGPAQAQATAALDRVGAPEEKRPSAERAAQRSQPLANGGRAQSGEPDITRVMASVRDEDVRVYRASCEQGAGGKGSRSQARAADEARKQPKPAEGVRWDVSGADTSGIDVINTSPGLYGSYPAETGAGAFQQRGAAPAVVAAAYQDLAWCSEAIARIIANIEMVVIGKREAVEMAVLALVMGGHVLIEDLPGTGKTSLAAALANSIDCKFRRIQFTPDVMPSEITGCSVFNQRTGAFAFQPGAIMANVVLADEINRATAKTQSAMLEAMEERQVTVEGTTYRLAEPFMVIATQNPIEQYGVYPLPEAQMDRFLVKMSMGYLKEEDEARAIMRSDQVRAAFGPVVTGEDVLVMRAQAQGIYASKAIVQYAVQLAAATRTASECSHGASPRGSKALIDLARARALRAGREYVSPDDVKAVAHPALAHRIALTRETALAGRTADDVIDAILEKVAVPESCGTGAEGSWN